MTNSSLIRKIAGDAYNFRRLYLQFSDTEIAKYKSSLLQQFSLITKSWNDNLHSEWTARMFLSAKMIYSSALLLNSLDYSRRKNIIVTEPYLLYYSLLNCSRALTFTLPSQLWKDGEILLNTHSKIINVTSDSIKLLNKGHGKELNNILNLSKDYRELFSYRFPGDGLQRDFSKKINLNSIAEHCTLLCEVAQFTSELFEKSFDKNCSAGSFNLNQLVLESCFIYSGDSGALWDYEDAYRISYIMRKVKRPYNIYLTMSEGMTEDFFGSWMPDEDEHDKDAFNPDEREIKIFSFP